MSQILLEKVTLPLDGTAPDIELLKETSAARPRHKKKTKSRMQQASKVSLHWIRRGHLYFGLFLFPWALLYGVTAFLFNHPTAFSDQKSIAFSRTDYGGETLPTAQTLASEVLAKLNTSQKPEIPYELAVGETRYVREFAFATFKGNAKDYNLLLDLNNGSGTIREQVSRQPVANATKPERAPFATGEPSGPPSGGRSGGERRVGGQGGRGGGPVGGRPSSGIETTLKAQIEMMIPRICKSAGIDCSNVVITSIPDLSFPVRVGADEWVATYSPMIGNVSGRKAEATSPPSEMTWRRFLLRLHTAHGYPSSGGVRWYWAVIVDVMAGIMCFWGLSGILMWWQIKSTRLMGLATLALGLFAATGLGIGMHFAMR